MFLSIYFSDFKGILKTSIIAGILLRESISFSKLPEPTEDKNSFQVPVGIPVNMGNISDIDPKGSKHRRKQAGLSEKKVEDKLSSDEDKK